MDVQRRNIKKNMVKIERLGITKIKLWRPVAPPFLSIGHLDF